jgi:pimeloyl-ACP methyl ester carboxylesterase
VIRFLLFVLAAAVLAYVAACAGLYAWQRQLMYFPQPRRLADAQSADSFRHDGVRLQLTVRPHAGRGALLYFGGNAEDVSASLAPLVAAFPDREVVALHYRGYGGSEGRPSEAAIAADAAALFDRVYAAHPDVIVMGRSLGSGVATRLAATRPATGLVLVTPYDSLLALAQAEFPWFPVRWLLRDRYETWRYVPAVKVPVLILRAGQDEVIPAASTERLAARFPPGQARLVVLPRAGHNNIADDPLYLQSLQAFDRALIPLAPAPAPAESAPT